MKEDMIKELRVAKRAHKQWIRYAHALAQGIPLNKDQLPMTEISCHFGHWWSKESQKFNSLANFNHIGKLHAQIHNTYSDILTLLFPVKEAGLWRKWLGKKSQVLTDENSLQLKQKIVVLTETSKALVYHLDQLERLIIQEIALKPSILEIN